MSDALPNVLHQRRYLIEALVGQRCQKRWASRCRRESCRLSRAMWKTHVVEKAQILPIVLPPSPVAGAIHGHRSSTYWPLCFFEPSYTIFSDESSSFYYPPS